jgi:hypothetical protein
MEKTVLTVALACALAACGGGGASTDGVTVQTFDFASALKTRLASANPVNLTISGTANYGGVDYPVSGTLQLSDSPLTTVQFEGQTVSQTTESIAGLLFVAGQTFPLSSSMLVNYSSAFNVAGVVWPDLYCVTTSGGTLPGNVAVGDSGGVATLKCYSDATKNVLVGTNTLTYSVAAGKTAQTVNVTISAKAADAANVPFRQITTTFALTSTGAISVVGYGAIQSISGVAVSITAK